MIELEALLEKMVWPNGLVLGIFQTGAEAIKKFQTVSEAVQTETGGNPLLMLVSMFLAAGTFMAETCQARHDDFRAVTDDTLREFVGRLAPCDTATLLLMLTSMTIGRSYHAAGGRGRIDDDLAT